MHFKIHYSCLSHIGNIRRINQDNFICSGRYLDTNDSPMIFPLCGTKNSDDMSVFGIFDGMGGEECGEVAAYIASKTASDIKIGSDAATDLSQFCFRANDEICDYAELNGISAMGTTAAMLAFTEKEIVLCNIGDSKIFRFCDGALDQISEDHVSVSVFGRKPPLSQNLGIPPSEFVIAPYLARGAYNDGDIYLICSDGLTDMVSVEEITDVLISSPINEAVTLLLNRALANGGKDNTTIILCKVERQFEVFSRKSLANKRKEV